MLSLLELLLGGAAGVAEAVINGLGTIISFMLGWSLDILVLLIGWLPAIDWPISASQVYEVINSLWLFERYFPLAEGLLLFVLFVQFLIAYTVLKMVFKAIPFVG